VHCGLEIQRAFVFADVGFVYTFNGDGEVCEHLVRAIVGSAAIQGAFVCNTSLITRFVQTRAE